MAVNHYMMHRDLQDIKANWRTKDFMAAFVRTYPDSAEYKKENMVSDFFDIVEHRMKKIQRNGGQGTYRLRLQGMLFLLHMLLIGWWGRRRRCGSLILTSQRSIILQ